MTFLTMAGLAALALLGGMAEAAVPNSAREAMDPGTDDELAGLYQIVEGERNGEKISADRLKEVTVAITPNAITTFDRDKQEVYAASYEIDTRHNPWRIVMTSTKAPGGEKGAKAQGLVEKSKEGDKVRLIYALPEGKLPTEFQTGLNQQMFTLKKMTK